LNGRVARDWVGWHEGYDVAGSSLARRLAVVQGCLAGAISCWTGRENCLAAPTAPVRPPRLISMCAGDGRDVLPVLAAHPDGRAVRALLIEISPELSARARSTAAELGLPEVEVLTADAGATATYAGVEPADVLLACGVFGNVSHEDMRRTVAALPALTAPGATVIWTRGRGGDADRSAEVRARFLAEGFTELAFSAPDDARFRVGVARRPETVGPPLPSTPWLFRFR
jgi:hypothetical protein